MRNELQGRVGDRFVLERLAGAGGMGEVYRAKDEQSGLSVAVKIMRWGSSDDATRFVREARILSELDHPCIVRHIAHGVMEEGAPWLAMEWLDGEDLAVRLCRGRLTVDETLRVAQHVAEGLAMAHARGFVHRDLKPSNLFLVGGQCDDVRILDFGIAVARRSTRMTRTGMLLGTPGYMAPEQARGEEMVDARADVYSLGSVLFECLTGEPLFSGVHVAALLAKVLFEEAPRLRDKLPTAPTALDELLAQMLTKEPAERFENGQVLAGALKSLGRFGDTEVHLVRQSVAPAVPSLTIGEKKGIAVIFIAARDAHDERVSGTSATLQVAEDPRIRAEAERFEGRCESLLDGSIAVLLMRTSMATDLAARAARCALSLRALVPGRTIALAKGRADSTHKSLLGQVIDRAAMLSGLGKSKAVESVVLLDDMIAGLLDARFDVREDATGFVLHGERDLAEGTRTLLGMATPCVGRERELRHIEGSFEECLEGNAQVVLVTAPAGVGKSRLGHEFLRTVQERHENVAIWIARGDSLRAGSALGMLARAVCGACGIQEGEPLDTRRQKVRARVAERVAPADCQRVTEFLGELMGTSFPDEDSLPLRAARLDALLMTEQMRTAFLDFLAAECAARPVLILLEDLHWGDRPTIQFLDHALRELHDQPIFVLALSRPEVRDLFPDLWAHRRLLEIQLKELGRRAIERLVRHVLGENVAAETIERLVRLSEGNAFYLEELIRFAAEGRAGELPETVVSMVQSRLGTFDEASRRVLRAASIFGEVSWTAGIAVLLGDGDRRSAVETLLLNLVDREVLVRRKDSRFLNETEFAFRHALLREGAYGMLTEDDRALGHKLAGEWLENRGEDDALLLADHFEKGGEKDHAARHYYKAVVRAYLAGDSKAAIDDARRGLACVLSTLQRVQLLGMLCEAHFWLMEFIHVALPYANEVCELAVPGTQPWLQGTILKMNTALTRGNIDEFSAMLSACMNIEPQSIEEAGGVFFALGTGAIGLDFLGRVEEGNRVIERLHVVARSMDAHGFGVVFVPPHAMPAMRDCYAYEDPAGGLNHSEAARSLTEANGDRRFREMNGGLFAGMNRWLLGDIVEARRILTGVKLPDDAFGYVSSFRPFVLAWIYADAGDLEKARVHAEFLVQSGKTRKLLLDEGRGHWVLGEVLRRAGDFAAANSEFEAAKSILQMICALDVPGVLASIAALRHAEGRHEEALAIATEALEKYATIGACSQFFRGAYLRLVHAEILESLGRREEACKAIRTARDCIQNNARKIAEPHLRLSFLENVPENRRTLDLAKQWCGEGE